MDLGTNSRCQVIQQFILDFSCVVIYSWTVLEWTSTTTVAVHILFYLICLLNKKTFKNVTCRFDCLSMVCWNPQYFHEKCTVYIEKD